MIAIPWNPEEAKKQHFAENGAEKQNLISKLKKQRPEIFDSEGKIKGKLCMYAGMKFLVLP